MAHKVTVIKEKAETNDHNHVKGANRLYRMVSVMVVCIMIGTAFGVMISADTPTGFPTVIEPGSMVQDAKFLVFNDGTSYYAKNGMTGQVAFSGTNASAVINSALGNLTTGRSWQEKVKLQGNFEIAWSIRIPNSTILDIGSSRIKLADGSVVPILTNNNTATGNVNITVTGGQLVGNQPTQVGAGGYGIYFLRVIRGEISNVRIFQADLDAICLERCERIMVRDCQIEDCAEGILLAVACFDNVISNNMIKNMMEQDGLEVSGITAQSARNSFINNVVIGPTPGNTGIDVFENSLFTVIQGNTFIDTGGLSIGGASSIGSDGAIVTGNIVTDSTGLATYGIQVARASNCIVEGNIVKDMNGQGILVTTLSNRTTISGNSIENVGKVAGGAAGIAVTGGTNHTIIGNYVHDTGQACMGITANDCVISSNVLSYPGAASPYGLSLNGKRNIVTANHCEGGTRGMLIYGYGNLVEGNDVRNNTLSAKLQTDGYSTIRYNLGYVTESNGNQSITGAVNFVTFAHGLALTPILTLVTPIQTGYGNISITVNLTYITISFDNQPGGATWYFHWYAQTW